MLTIGVMSGTSVDGVDVALVSIKGEKVELKGFRSYPYSPSLRKKILSAASLSLSEVSQLNFEIGKVFAKAVLSFLKKQRVSSKKIYCIGSHGQTVFHKTLGKKSEWSTFQLGEPSFIAAHTGILTVADFRPKDMAFGGHGAPLTPCFHYAFFKKRGPLVVHNLGGMSNMTYIPKGGRKSKVIGFDSGPANCLIDGVIRHLTSQKYDSGGKLAASGRVHQGLVRRWMKNSFFSKKLPKSCGQEEFGENFIQKILKQTKGLSKKDIVATVTAFTAESIVKSYENYILKKNSLREIVFCGGGY